MKFIFLQIGHSSHVYDEVVADDRTNHYNSKLKYQQKSSSVIQPVLCMHVINVSYLLRSVIMWLFNGIEMLVNKSSEFV